MYLLMRSTRLATPSTLAWMLSVYRGKQFEKGKKSIALGLQLQDTSRTLTDHDADQIVAQVVDHLGRQLNATIRDK